MRVALFITCFNDTLFPATGKSMVSLLERLGHTVDFPRAQTCCGQMHYNTGYQRETVPLVRHFVDVFRDAETIISPSASCVGMVHEVYPKAAALAEDESLARAVSELIPRVHEFSMFLVHKLGVEDVGAYFRTGSRSTRPATRSGSCGLATHLSGCCRVRGIDLVELPHADECCGFGGLLGEERRHFPGLRRLPCRWDEADPQGSASDAARRQPGAVALMTRRSRPRTSSPR